MKCSFTRLSTPDSTLDHVLDIAKHLSYDGIGLRIGATDAYGVEVAADAAAPGPAAAAGDYARLQC